MGKYEYDKAVSDIAKDVAFELNRGKQSQSSGDIYLPDNWREGLEEMKAKMRELERGHKELKALIAEDREDPSNEFSQKRVKIADAMIKLIQEQTEVNILESKKKEELDLLKKEKETIEKKYVERFNLLKEEQKEKDDNSGLTFFSGCFLSCAFPIALLIGWLFGSGTITKIGYVILVVGIFLILKGIIGFSSKPDVIPEREKELAEIDEKINAVKQKYQALLDINYKARKEELIKEMAYQFKLRGFADEEYAKGYYYDLIREYNNGSTSHFEPI